MLYSVCVCVCVRVCARVCVCVFINTLNPFSLFLLTLEHVFEAIHADKLGIAFPNLKVNNFESAILRNDF